MLGISIYPEKSNIKDSKDYLNLAAKYGFKRVFTCLLSVEKPQEEIKADFLEIITHARNLDMEVILDVAPNVFQELKISYNDLKFFSELNATGIRLDLGFDGMTESQMTVNPYGLDIEINMSQDTGYLDNIMSYLPDTEKLIGCHNFYPQKYTGLSLEHFISSSKRFKKYNIRTCAFVNSEIATDGPWPVTEGLCTLEMHRELPIETQVKHLYSTGLIDDIIIANQFASEEEMKKISEIKPVIMPFSIDFEASATELDNKIVFEEEHYQRGDVNDFLVRSTQPRVKYKNFEIPVGNTQKVIKKGAIVIGNDNFGQYKGELQLVKKDIIDENQFRNIVGKVKEEELFLIDLLKPWQKFEFKK